MTNEQLVTLYDENPDVTVEMLSDNFGYELEAVKLALAGSSTRYRKELRKDDTIFTDEEFDMAKRGMVELAKRAEVEAVKFRALKFVIDEHMGRNKTESAKGAINNINIVNVHVQKARQALAKSKAQKPIVDVESMKQLREVEVAA
jgi:hypothetical protein